MELENVAFDRMDHWGGNTELWFFAPSELFPNPPERMRRVVLQITYPHRIIPHARYRRSEIELVALDYADYFLVAIDFPITEKFFNQLIELPVREVI